MSTNKDDSERRRFTEEEFQTMLSDGIVSRDEDAILHDGFVLVPLALSKSLRPNPGPGPAGATALNLLSNVAHISGKGQTAWSGIANAGATITS